MWEICFTAGAVGFPRTFARIAPVKPKPNIPTSPIAINGDISGAAAAATASSGNIVVIPAIVCAASSPVAATLAVALSAAPADLAV